MHMYFYGIKSIFIMSKESHVFFFERYENDIFNKLMFPTYIYALWLPSQFRPKIAIALPWQQPDKFQRQRSSCPRGTTPHGGNAATVASSSAYLAFAWDCLVSFAACSGRISSIGSSTRLVKFSQHSWHSRHSCKPIQAESKQVAQKCRLSPFDWLIVWLLDWLGAHLFEDFN